VHNPRLWRSESVKRDPEKHNRVNQSDQGALSIGENPKVVHDQDLV
jgi:hypothetical protein